MGISRDLSLGISGVLQGSVSGDLQKALCLGMSGLVRASLGISRSPPLGISMDLWGDLLGIFRRNLQVSLGMSKDP
jgi:hypothetical protein